MNDTLTAKERLHAWLVFYAITSANVLMAVKAIDGPTYWKTVTFTLAMLILGAGVTGLVGIWTVTAAAKAQAAATKEQSR